MAFDGGTGFDSSHRKHAGGRNPHMARKSVGRPRGEIGMVGRSALALLTTQLVPVVN